MMAKQAVGKQRTGGLASGMAHDRARVIVVASAACAGVLVSGMAYAASGNPEIGLGYEIAINVFSWARQHVEGIVSTAYDRAPALVMVLAAMFIIPVMALIALLVHALRLQWTLRRPSPNQAQQPDDLQHTPADRPLRAQLLIAGQPSARLPSGPIMVRIGRHEDNDIRLGHASVHRHHALIHRNGDDEFVIVDLSGRDGNGVLVNGERTPEARLNAGDEIQLGNVSLRFEAAA